MTRTTSTVDTTSRRAGRRVAVSLMLIALLAVVAAALRLAPSPAQAATTDVTIKDFKYRPQEIHVNVGDTVTWTNRESGKRTHTVIQDEGAWTSDGNRTNDPNAEVKPGSAFSHTFDTDDTTYGYHCRLHTYMTGRVIVGKGTPAGAPPPTEEPAPTPTPQSGPLPPLPPPLGKSSGTNRTSHAPTDAAPVGREQAAAAPSAAPAYAPTELPQGVSGPGTLGDGTRLAPYTTDKNGVKSSTSGWRRSRGPRRRAIPRRRTRSTAPSPAR